MMYIVSNHDACGCLPCDTPCNNCQGSRCVCLYKRPHAVAPVCSTRKCAEIDSLKVPYWFCVLKFSCLNICLCDYRTYSSCILGIYGQRIGSIAPVCRYIDAVNRLNITGVHPIQNLPGRGGWGILQPFINFLPFFMVILFLIYIFETLFLSLRYKDKTVFPI